MTGATRSFAADALGDFNACAADTLTTALLGLTAAPQWAATLVAERPYPGIDDILTRSDEILAAVDVDQIDAALAGHPRIGESAQHPDNQHLDDEEASRSAREQAGMESAGAEQAAAMAAANADYEARFGRIYLVAAAGLSAAELLAKAQARLHNDPDTELDVVRSELARITRLRLLDMFRDPSAP